MSREIEHRSASACTFTVTTAILSPSVWRPISEFDDAENLPDDYSAAKCTALAEGSSIRVSPMEKSRGGWDEEHFCTGLKLPEGSAVGRGMVVMLEGEFVQVDIVSFSVLSSAHKDLWVRCTSLFLL